MAALIGYRIRTGLERPRRIRRPSGRPRAQVSSDQVLALREEGLSYRAIARRLHISAALAHRLVHHPPLKGPEGVHKPGQLVLGT